MAWSIGTRGGERRERRREKRREKRRDKRARAANAKYLGGSPDEEKLLVKEAKDARTGSRARVNETYASAEKDRAQVRAESKKSGLIYDNTLVESRQASDRNQDSIGEIGLSARDARQTIGNAGQVAQNEFNIGAQQAVDTRNSALNTNRLTGTAENVLQQRTAQIAGTPSIGALTDAALLQNAQSAQQQLGANAGMLNRQAMGLAAGQGEGSALAMQAALAGAGQGASDALVQNQLQQNDLAAQLRFAAAQQQRQQDLTEADYASQLRMSTAGAERQAQLGFAGANADQLAQAAQQRAATGLQVAGQQAELQYNPAVQQQQAQAQALQLQQRAQEIASQRQLGLLGQNLTAGQQQQNAALSNQSQELDYSSNLIGAQYGAQQARAPKVKGVMDWVNTGLSSIFDPMDLRGSGQKGIGH